MGKMEKELGKILRRLCKGKKVSIFFLVDEYLFKL